MKIRDVVILIFKWIEFVLRSIIPICAVLVLCIKIFKPDILDNDTTVIHLILLIVSGLAISEGLSRFITLENIKQKVENLYNYDIPNQDLLSSAHQYGITGIASRNDEEWLTDLLHEIKRSNSIIDICGVALPSIASNNELMKAIFKHSEKHDVRFLLLDPTCEEAKRRENIEKPLGTRTIADIKGTIDTLKQEMAKNRQIRVHLYNLPPMIGLYISEHYAFMEPYHFGRPEGINGCIGGHVPLFKIKNNTEKEAKNTYAFFKSHFQYLWNNTRGGRVNLDFETIEFKPGNYIKIKNKNGFPINLTGWSLAAQGKNEACQFDHESTWNDNDEITIFINKSNEDPQQLSWDIDDLEASTILTLQNVNGTTVSQWLINGNEC